MKTITLSLIAVFLAFAVTLNAQERKAYPKHWGGPPMLETRDIRPLPGGYGQGSSTLAKWIQKNLDKDKASGGKTPSDDAEGWVSLFDGKSLDGWSVKSGFATYEVKDGTIVGTTAKGSGNTFLCTDKKYGNFVLEFEVRVHNNLNSGVQVRAQLKKPEGKYGGRVNGPQVEIEASGAKGAEAGYVYGEATGRGWLTPKERLKPHKHFKDGEWNKFRVVAMGPRIQTWINGEPIEDLTDEEIYKTHSKGLIGLQVHGVGNQSSPFTAEWRNLRIQPRVTAPQAPASAP